MVSCNTLVSTSFKGAKIISIQCAYHAGDVLTFVVDCASKFTRCRDRCDVKPRGWNNKTFVNKDIGVFRMVYDHKTEIIVVIRLPKFGGDAQVVITIVGHKLVATDLVPLFSRFYSSCSECVDAQADRGAPRHRIFYEFHLLTVVSKKKWT